MRVLALGNDAQETTAVKQELFTAVHKGRSRSQSRLCVLSAPDLRCGPPAECLILRQTMHHDAEHRASSAPGTGGQDRFEQLRVKPVKFGLAAFRI